MVQEGERQCVDGIMQTTPTNVYNLTPRVFEYVRLHEKGSLRLQMEVNQLKWKWGDYPRSSAWAQGNHKGPLHYKRQSEESLSKSEKEI